MAVVPRNDSGDVDGDRRGERSVGREKPGVPDLCKSPVHEESGGHSSGMAVSAGFGGNGTKVCLVRTGVRTVKLYFSGAAGPEDAPERLLAGRKPNVMLEFLEIYRREKRSVDRLKDYLRMKHEEQSQSRETSR